MKKIIILTLLTISVKAKSHTIELQKLPNHLIQYYVSLPKDWVKEKAWPVIIVLESADKEYKKNMERFVAAPGKVPFILVAPINTNNGNQGDVIPNFFPTQRKRGTTSTR